MFLFQTLPDTIRLVDHSLDEVATASMTLGLYAKCFAVALIGCALQAVLKIKSIQDKARIANVEFRAATYFKEDWLSLLASLLTIILFLFFIGDILNWKPSVINYALIGFAFVGYTGSDIASRFFSVVNKRINAAIDYKTTEADRMAGTLDKPTPAVKT